MYDTHALIQKFQKEHVALRKEQSQDMQARRDTNLNRLASGLTELNKPQYVDWFNQGGNAMRTMTQKPEGDEGPPYDIDVGVVFEDDDASSPKTTKSWVCDAIKKKGTNFKTEPEPKKKCVRIVYNEGYQVDLAVFRRMLNNEAWAYEIAIGDEWKASDPKAINKWFEERIRSLSPDADGTYQLRRIVRLVKYFAKVRATRSGMKFPAGLVVTTLAVECYEAVKDRDDQALYLTLDRLRNRSEYQPVVANGTVIAHGEDPESVKRIKRLKDAAGKAVEALAPLVNDEETITAEKARKAWKKVFSHTFFDSDAAKSAIAKSELAAPAVLSDISRNERLSLAETKAAKVSAPTRPWRK